jgi:glutathione S-transferase
MHTAPLQLYVDSQFASPWAMAVYVALEEKRIPFTLHAIDLNAEAFPDRKVYPAAMQARAWARQLQGWIRSDLAAMRSERSTETIFYAPAQMPLSADAQHAAQRFFRVLNTLIQPGQTHLFGDAWCVADVDVTVMLMRLIKSGDNLPAHLQDYALGQWARPAMQRWILMKRPPRA